MQKKRGIILRSFLPYKQKISVLTERYGKINMVVRDKKSRFPAGSIVTFNASLSARFVVMSDKEFIYVPMDGVVDRLYWLHHILEICYYLLPLRLPSEEIFRVVLNSIRISRQADEVVRRICLLKLLMLLGFYPENELIGLSNLFDRVVLTFLDSSDNRKVRSLQRRLSMLLQKVPKPLLEQVDKWIKTLSYMEKKL
jgi:hypothetical protein